MPAVLLATCADLPDGDEDATALGAALREFGVEPQWAEWTDPRVDWAAALVVLRSTWDYTARRKDFLTWIERSPRLANAAPVVQWNTDKIYLRDLVLAGVPTVPTTFAEPGEPLDLPTSGEFVVKPSLGAGSRGAGRFTAQRAAAAREHAAALHQAGRTVLVQPYLTDVDSLGETSLVYFDGTFSHAIRKGPMLPAGTAHPVDGDALYIEENITARTPSPAELAVGAAVLTVIRKRFGRDQLYTRVDLLPAPGGPVVIELELTEPSLFLSYASRGADTAAQRFAAAIAARA